MFGLGIWELLIILGIVVLLFGAKRLPMIGEGVGKMITNFKKTTNELENKEEAGNPTVINPETQKKEASQS